MMLRSEGITNVLKAIHTARKQFKTVAKTRENTHRKYKYADIAAYLDAIEDGLSAAGLVLCQTTERDANQALQLVTHLFHVESGEFVGSSTPLVPDDDSLQGLGSAFSYIRRYALASLLGLAAEDDDANDESRRGDHHHRQPAPPPRPHNPATSPRPVADFNSWLDGAVKALGLEGEAGLWQTVNHLHRRMVETGAAAAVKSNGERVARLKAHYGTDGGRQWLRDECRAYAVELKQRATVPPDEADPDEDELGSRE